METFAKFVGGVIGYLAIAVAMSLLTALPFMLAMGNLHSHWQTVPALGFWDVWSVTVWLSAGIALMRADVSKD